MINFKVNFKLNKTNYLSDVETYEIVKFLTFLDKAKRNIFDHLELDKEEEEEEEERKRIGFKTNREKIENNYFFFYDFREILSIKELKMEIK